MPKIPPKVAAIHDLSCFGRCALTVIIPTLSALGAQTVPVPTALLSTHTGGFENMLFVDLIGEMNAIADYKKMLSLLKNEDVAALIERIVLDEELHLAKLSEAYRKICDHHQ